MSGIFGVVSRSNCMEDLFYGTDYQSHLGTEFGGLAIQGNKVHRSIKRIANGQFKNLLYEFYRSYAGELGIGVVSDRDVQPILLESRFGRFSLVTAGLITNLGQVARGLIDQGVTFSESMEREFNQTEVVAKLISRNETILEGIEDVFDRIEGSVSLLLMGEKGLYAACDKGGRLPLTIGKKVTGSLAVTSESCAFPNLGYEPVKSMQGGEIVFLDASGMREERGPSHDGKVCAFLWIYTGYPASTYEGISVESVREHCGQALARKDAIEADLVSGVPDSGTGHAVGYAMESGLPFRRPLVKYSAGYGRSYTPPSQDIRDHIAKMKLIAIEDVIRGNRLVVCEDSIVRGTQLRNLTIQKLWEASAAEVHIRVACPPLMFPCKYNLSTRSLDELAARRAIMDMEEDANADIGSYLDPTHENYQGMVEWIRKDIRATSLSYLTLEEMIEAVGLPECRLCTYCWNGHD